MPELARPVAAAARAASATSHSPASLVSPYGDSGAVGVASVTSSTSGVPYTAADDEKTIAGVPTSAMAARSRAVPTTFCS